MAVRKITSFEFNPDFESYGGAQKAFAYSGREYYEVENGRYVRPSYDRDDYDAFRGGEATPKKQKRIIAKCMDSYNKVGIIRNVIDLMGDFGCQGISIVHPDKKIERFYRKWFFEKIKGLDRSERFLNYLYRTGNVVVQRNLGRITIKQEKEYKKATALRENIIPKTYKREIPLSYEFINPLFLDYKKEDGKNILMLNLSDESYNSLRGNNNNEFISPDIQSRIRKGERQIPLDMTKISMYYYKKDDWMLWANPMIYPILDDINMLEKMKLADLAALDGAISSVRLWILGSLEHKIVPKKAMIDKLRDIIASNVGGGVFDLVWGPDLQFIESNTQIYKFLGSEKYTTVLASIYAGLGVPPTLTGASNSSGGFTNNYVSLKTLIERLEYGREVLTAFWTTEFEIVQKAMGFKTPAQIHFDSIVLSDEAAMKNLLISLNDRNLLSDETLQERFREIPGIEKVRIEREAKEKTDNPNLPQKASPFHNPQQKDEMTKLALNNDVLHVEDYFGKMGIKSKKPTPKPVPRGAGPGNKTQRAKPKKVSAPSGGRPKSKKDTTKRKQKRVLPRSKADDSTLMLWVAQAQKQISDILTPFVLEKLGKKNLRGLTNAEFYNLESMKLCVLTYSKPFDVIDENFVSRALASKSVPSAAFISTVQKHVENFTSRMSRKPTTEEFKQIYSYAYLENC